MIHSLRGNIFRLKPWELLLEVMGVGYHIRITFQAYEELKKQDSQEILFYTRVIYRENEQLIYGFLFEEEAQLFDFLRSLSGVGPQLASNVISTLGTQTLFSAIENKDVSTLTKVPKIGKSIADKILFEATHKKKKLEMIKANLSGLPEVKIQTTDGFMEQLEEALFQLGFQKKEIDKASEKINQSPEEKLSQETENLQAWIRLYLRYL